MRRSVFTRFRDSEGELENKHTLNSNQSMNLTPVGIVPKSFPQGTHRLLSL